MKNGMEWISSWIQGIIIAVIIGTIIEMILPEGNSKKYIKVVIGIYILCSIISPVITKITKKEIHLSNVLNLEEYIETSNSKAYENLNNNQDTQIRTIYEEQLKQDMKEKIASKGYEVLNIYLRIANDKQYTIERVEINVRKQNENLNKEDIENSNKDDKETSNEKNTEKSNINGAKNGKELVEKIENVEIKVETENSKNNSNVQKNNSIMQENQNNRNDLQENANNKNDSQENVNNESISKKEKDELKEYLSSIYAIKKENININ